MSEAPKIDEDTYKTVVLTLAMRTLISELVESGSIDKDRLTAALDSNIEVFVSAFGEMPESVKATFGLLMPMKTKQPQK